MLSPGFAPFLSYYYSGEWRWRKQVLKSEMLNTAFCFYPALVQKGERERISFQRAAKKSFFPLCPKKFSSYLQFWSAAARYRRGRKSFPGCFEFAVYFSGAAANSVARGEKLFQSADMSLELDLSLSPFLDEDGFGNSITFTC